MRDLLRWEFIRLKLGLAKAFRKPPPADPFAYDEELVPVSGSPHRSGAVALDPPEPFQSTDARGHY
jgi:hypothetical protein